MCDFAILSPMRWAGVGVEGGGVRNFISEFLRSFFCVLESCGDLILLILRPSHFKIVGRNLICWKWSSPPHTQHEWGEKLSTPIILGLTQFFPLSGWGWEVEEEKSHNKAHSSTQLSAHFPGNSFPYASRVIICLQTVWQCWETFCFLTFAHMQPLSFQEKRGVGLHCEEVANLTSYLVNETLGEPGGLSREKLPFVENFHTIPCCQRTPCAPSPLGAELMHFLVVKNWMRQQKKASLPKTGKMNCVAFPAPEYGVYTLYRAWCYSSCSWGNCFFFAPTDKHLPTLCTICEGGKWIGVYIVGEGENKEL